ncbi:MAG: L-threonylcarbamoyladenylate synthase [Gammaproteobacteria bacterium]
MALFIEIHPENPQPRLVKQAVDIIRAGGVIIYPTDSCYALGCQIGNKHAMDRIRTIRKLGEQHNFTLVCNDLSEIATYAMVDNAAYRLLKTHTPGPYTFVLKATHEVPRRLQHPKRKTIGLRIPGNPIAQAILKELGEPLMSSTLILPGDDLPMTDPQEMYDTLGHQVDLVINGGNCGAIPTTVVELIEGAPVVARHGLGDAGPFEA